MAQKWVKRDPKEVLNGKFKKKSQKLPRGRRLFLPISVFETFKIYLLAPHTDCRTHFSHRKILAFKPSCMPESEDLCKNRRNLKGRKSIVGKEFHT